MSKQLTLTAKPAPFFVDGSVPERAVIRSGPLTGQEVKWTDRRLKARDEYHEALLEAAIQTAEDAA